MEWIWALLRRCWEFEKSPQERCTASECFQTLDELPDPDPDTIQSYDMDDLDITYLFDLVGVNGAQN